jgi:hypothetical protein
VIIVADAALQEVNKAITIAKAPVDSIGQMTGGCAAQSFRSW